MTDTPDQDLPPFSAFVTEHRGGKFNAEITARLAEVVRRVAATDRKGTITVKLTVEKIGAGQIVVTDTVDHRPPRDVTTSLWFYTDGGGLSRRDPNQQAFPVYDDDTERTHE